MVKHPLVSSCNTIHCKRVFVHFIFGMLEWKCFYFLSALVSLWHPSRVPVLALTSSNLFYNHLNINDQIMLLWGKVESMVPMAIGKNLTFFIQPLSNPAMTPGANLIYYPTIVLRSSILMCIFCVG